MECVMKKFNLLKALFSITGKQRKKERQYVVEKSSSGRGASFRDHII